MTVFDNAYNGQPLAQGYNPPAATANVDSVQIDAAGIITVTYAPPVAAAGCTTLEMTPQPALVVGVIPTDRISWSCSVGGNCDNRFRPSICRN
ncbi:MAG: pilin [Xanthomonadales bacterium]|nr:pilin [Xanthomonadales bacterium]